MICNHVTVVTLSWRPRGRQSIIGRSTGVRGKRILKESVSINTAEWSRGEWEGVVGSDLDTD